MQLHVLPCGRPDGQALTWRSYQVLSPPFTTHNLPPGTVLQPSLTFVAHAHAFWAAGDDVHGVPRLHIGTVTGGIGHYLQHTRQPTSRVA